MRLLTTGDFQKIDEELVTQAGGGTRALQINRLRDIAEIHRVFASRAANLARELHDERQNHERF